MAGKGSPKGVRYGGRKPGVPNKATLEIRGLARKYAPAAMEELARLSVSANDERAKVAAIKEILDRGYGKSVQPVAGSDGQSPIGIVIVDDVPEEDGE